MSFSSSHTRRVLSAGAVIAVAVSLAACSSGGGSSDSSSGEDCTPAHEFETVTPGTLTVAAYDYPPLAVVNGDEFAGVEGDLLNEIAKMECLTLTVDAAGGASASIPSVQSGRADLAGGSWYRTKERAKIVTLGAPLILSQDAVVSKEGLTMDDLEGKKVASVVGNLWNESLQTWLGDDFSVYQDNESIYGDLEAGRIDAIITNYFEATQRLESSPIEGATIEAMTPRDEVPESQNQAQINWPSSKDNPELSAAIDADIETLREDGTIAEVLEKNGLDPALAEVGDPIEL